jgi:hypothetical protein
MDWGSISGRGRDFSLHQHIQTGSRTCPASCTLGTGGCFPGCEADHLPPLVPRLRTSGITLPLPVHLHGSGA